MATKAIKKEKKEKKEEKKKEISKYAGVLLAPRITEKASYLVQDNVYTFIISPETTKNEVMKAMKDIHKVTPLKVNVVKNPAKKIFFKGKWGKVAGVKKAYVFLKEGDKIEN